MFQAGFKKSSFIHSNIWLLFPNILLGLMRDVTFADSCSALRRDTALETSTLPTEHTQIMYHGIFLLSASMPQPTGTGAWKDQCSPYISSLIISKTGSCLSRFVLNPLLEVDSHSHSLQSQMALLDHPVREHSPSGFVLICVLLKYVLQKRVVHS